MPARLAVLLAIAVVVLALGGEDARAQPMKASQAQEEPAAYPWRRRVATAARHARARRGRVAFAVVDETGRLRGFRSRDRYYSASVVKAMLMVTYLNHPSVRRRAIAPRDRALLRPMITRSDNDTATRIRNMVGDGALSRLARRAGMRDFATGVPWANTRITAADQARFFFRIESYIVPRHRSYARALLQRVIPAQRWGIPPVKPRGFDIFFKGGWRPTGAGHLVHQVALLERGDRRLAVAVLTDGNPSHVYGITTVRNVAERLLRGYVRFARRSR
jgi:hypothetical protein